MIIEINWTFKIGCKIHWKLKPEGFSEVCIIGEITANGFCFIFETLIWNFKL